MSDDRRRIGVYGATLVGLGGIIGGGMLILAGVAFGMAGPAAILALALDGVVAWLTAMSVTEISTAFPESGGAYTFAKKVLSVRAAFVVGWVLWFAYIVAGVLYALAFAAFTVMLMRAGCEGLGLGTEWLDSRTMVLLLAVLATAGYSIGLVRTSSGGGQWVTIGKVVLFLILIAAGVFAMVRQPLDDIPGELDGFFSGGFDGLILATGLMFISLQGFEMVSAIAGELKDPQRTIPKAIFGSLAISLAIYVPLLFLVATAGVDGGHINELAAANPDTVVAAAARQWMGGPGYWFVVTAIALATLSALQANLLTASRIAYAMAHDHALPAVVERTHPTRGTPVMAIYATALATVAIMFMLPDLTSAGAAASLIFLLAFALTHVTAYLARKRGGPRALDGGYRAPWFPVVPIVGGLACAGLGVFQAIVVPEAGKILVIWMGLGVMLYMALFKDRAEAADASAEALDPRLNRLRGKNPLVLLPIANPKSARGLVEIANALAPTEFARVLVLTIVRAARGGQGDSLLQLADAQEAVREALSASYSAGHAPEALITAASDPWPEIKRIAEEHACESLLLGLPRVLEPALDKQLEDLVNEVDCDVTLMRAPDEWKISGAKRVLVPIAGKSDEQELRSRILATISREAPREIVFMSVVPTTADDDAANAALRNLARLAEMKIPGTRSVEIVRADDVAAAILAESAKCDLVVLGMRRARTGKKQLGTINRKVVADATCAVMLLSTKAQLGVAELTRPISDLAQLVPFVPKRDASGE